MQLALKLPLERLPANIGSLVIAVVINILLLIFVIRLVTGEKALPVKTDDISVVDFVRIDRQEEPIKTITRERLPEPPKTPPPPPPETPPPDAKPPPPTQLNVPQPQLSAVPLHITGIPQIGNVTAPAASSASAPVSAPITAAPAESATPFIEENIVPSYKTKPNYPPRAQRAGIEGTVTVEFVITETGNVTDPVVVNAEPPDIFNEAVLSAISKWKFSPKLVDGKPVARRARQLVSFSLQR